MKDQIRQSEVLASRREAWKGLTDQSREAGNLQSKIYLRQKPADLSAVANTLEKTLAELAIRPPTNFSVDSACRLSGVTFARYLARAGLIGHPWPITNCLVRSRRPRARQYAVGLR
jgi:hypothetical protein